jgi:hypothetical protein
MKLSEHIIEYLIKGLQLSEMVRGQRSPKEFRKFQVAEDLFYFVHDSGYILQGKTLITAGRPPRDILKDIAKWGSRNDLFQKEIQK